MAGVFIESRDAPERAPSDGPNMVPLAEFEGLMSELLEIDALVKARGRQRHNFTG